MAKLKANIEAPVQDIFTYDMNKYDGQTFPTKDGKLGATTCSSSPSRSSLARPPRRCHFPRPKKLNLIN